MLHAVLSKVKSAPGVTAVLVVLLAVTVVFWRQDSRGRVSSHVAHIEKVQAQLYDGECEFSADVVLTGRWGRVVFGLRENSVRSALADLMRTKSRYMVSSSTAREALRFEMLSSVNRVIGSGRATAVRLAHFELR
jgi:hypothetical protein